MGFIHLIGLVGASCVTGLVLGDENPTVQELSSPSNNPSAVRDRSKEPAPQEKWEKQGH